MMKSKEHIYLIIIIIIQVFLLLFLFTKKEGYHSDEVWNYAFANSAQSKELIYDDYGNTYNNQWITSETMRKYITVDRDHRFNYKSVFKNVSKDINPPLQYLVLHTICSFFPETFSWYFCFFINICSFVVSQVFLYLLMRKMTNNNWIGIAVVLLYGFGVGAMNITLFMRIYAFAVMFMVVFLYNCHMIYNYRNETYQPFRYYLGAGMTCFLGAYTLHLFLLTAFFVTISYSVYYFITKRYKVFFKHGLSVLSGALLSILLFPSTFADIGGAAQSHSYASLKYPFWFQFRIYLYNLTRELFGIHTPSITYSGFAIILPIIAGIVLVLISMWFVFRKENWLKRFIIKSKYRLREVIDSCKNFQFSCVAILIGCLATLLMVSDRTSIYYMGIYADRYIFIIYPISCVLVVSVLYFLFFQMTRKVFFSTAIMISLSLLAAIYTHIQFGSTNYLFLNDSKCFKLELIEEDARCILVVSSDWYVTCFAPKLYHTDQYYFSNLRDYEDNSVFDGVDKKKPYYLILDQKYIKKTNQNTDTMLEDNDFKILLEEALMDEERILSFYREFECVNQLVYVGTDSEMKQTFKIYRIDFK